jgi:hypothetical protein
MARADACQCKSSMEESTMRTAMFLTAFLLLGAAAWAQAPATAPAPQAPAHPEAGMMANPAPPPMMAPRAGWPPPPEAFHWRHRPFGVLIVDLILRVILTLAASFALVGLGIFLIRRGGTAPAVRA